ncbi:MAG: type II toxin-antitoxin system VapC family toxin, partial [Mesorhizobium sp.]
MPFVVDLSMAAAWILPDEDSEAAAALMRGLPGTTAPVPSLFWHEARNVVLMAERRGRTAAGEAATTMARLRRLPLEDAGGGSDGAVLTLASHGLSAYDATYLALAIETELPLATLDRKLALAARRQGIRILGPLANGN